jgi:hypothetical protein
VSQFHIEKTLQLLTATFVHGAYQVQRHNVPDLRPASIRGQLRWWFDALFGDRAAEDRIFGNIKEKNGSNSDSNASKIIVRLRNLDRETGLVDFMPHKPGGVQKTALLPGSRFQLEILGRRTALPEEERARLTKSLRAWLLLGAIGQRANRAAGSIWCDDAPRSESDFLESAGRLLGDTKLKAALLPGTYSSEHSLRHEAGDFLRKDDVENPFGTAGNNTRKPSQLRLRAVRLDDSLRLAALWDGRFDSFESLRSGVAELAQARKPIGLKLEKVLPQLEPFRFGR